MVVFFIILLVVSIVGMSVLLFAKQYELSTGRMMFARSRPAISKFSSRAMFLFGTAVPLYLRWQARRAYAKITALAHRGVARGALSFEGWLEGVLSSVREKTSAQRAPGEASAFLREVGEYKKKLSDGATDNNRIDQE
jgi:hypothetical protein